MTKTQMTKKEKVSSLPFNDHQEIKLWSIRNVWIQITSLPRKKLALTVNSFNQKLTPLQNEKLGIISNLYNIWISKANA